MFRWLSNLITLQEKRSFHGETVIFFALFVGTMRLLLEVFLVGFQGVPLLRNELLYVSWYLMCFFVFGLPVRILAPPPWQKRINVMLVGLFLGFMPPVIDVAVSGWGEVVMGYKGFEYAYIRDFPEGWPPWMIDPKKRMPVGEGSVLWLAVFFTGAYTWQRTKSVARTLAGLAMAYLACMFVGAILPTGLSKLHGAVFPERSMAWAVVFGQIAFALLVYGVFYRPSVAMLIARRFVHALPLVGMAVAGYAWIRPVDTQVLDAVLLISLSGVMTIVQNDHWDDLEEGKGGPERVARYDVVLIQFIWTMTVLSLYSLESVLALPMTVYGVASHLYNAPLYRGKRYFPANLKLEGLWGGAAFLMGLLAAAMPALVAAAEQRSFASRIQPWMKSMPLSWGFGVETAFAAFLAFGGWSVLASLKDEKDVESDMRTGVQTVFTLAIRRGIDAEAVSRAVRGLALVCLLIAAWAPLWIGRSTSGHAAALTALAFVIVIPKRRDPSAEFRMKLALLTVHLLTLAHGLSSTHG